MCARFGRALGIILMVFLAASCARLPAVGDESLPTETLPDSLTIPAEWGDLEAVTTLKVDTARLWFEDEDGNIRVVVYSGRSQQLQSNVRLIRRR